MIEIWPSLISADLLDLKHVLRTFDPLCTGYHIDIMDNHFVPNLTWGAQFANAIAAHTSKPVWLHLMIDAPTAFLDRLALPKNTYISFHAETKEDINSLIEQIQARSWLPSITLNPETPIKVVVPFLHSVKQVLVMSVNPGFSGQAFIPGTIEKVIRLKHILQTTKSDARIAVDGGINRGNIQDLFHAGATQLGIASGIFAQSNPTQELKELYALCSE